MKQVLSLPGGLRTLRWGTRFTLSLFLLFCLANYGVMAALGASRSGFGLARIAAYYRGDEAALQFGKTYGELLELTHFHLLAMPLLLFVQAHLFLLAKTWPARIKVALVAAGALGIAIDLAAPWLIVYVTPVAAVLKNAARLLMAPAFLAFALLPLYEMWVRRALPGEDQP